MSQSRSTTRAPCSEPLCPMWGRVTPKMQAAQPSRSGPPFVDRHADVVTRPAIIRVWLAVEQQHIERKDTGAAGVEKDRVQLLRSDLWTQRRSQISDLFDLRVHACRCMMHDVALLRRSCAPPKALYERRASRGIKPAVRKRFLGLSWSATRDNLDAERPLRTCAGRHEDK